MKARFELSFQISTDSSARQSVLQAPKTSKNSKPIQPWINPIGCFCCNTSSPSCEFG